MSRRHLNIGRSLVERTGGSAALLLALATFVGAAAVDQLAGRHIPSVHDEFAYLLAADTFSEGRLTNETHPHWQHFETFHVIHHPSYQGKYPPGQGLTLALGTKLGHPIIGVWLSGAAMVAAMIWMLAAFVAAPWAALGGALVTLKLGLASYWAQSYWGGSLAAAGGALMFGGAGRLWGGGGSFSAGVATGLGATIVSLTRPLEGLLLTAVVVGWIAFLGFRGRMSGIRGRRFVIGMAIVSVLGIAFHGFYNDRVTGSPLTLPYQVYERQYALAPNFVAWPAKPVDRAYRHSEIRRYHETWGLARHEGMRRPDRMLWVYLRKLAKLQATMLGPGLLALIALPAVLKWAPSRVALIATGVLLVSVLMTMGSYPHYLAPALGPVYVLVIFGLRRLWGLGCSITGRPMVLAIVLLFAVDFGLQVGRRLSGPGQAWAEQRQGILESLQASPGRDLVLVEYDPQHNVHQEWVYNRASIDASDVVWARSMGPSADAALAAYFSDRTRWRLSVNGEAHLEPWADTDAAH